MPAIVENIEGFSLDFRHDRFFAFDTLRGDGGWYSNAASVYSKANSELEKGPNSKISFFSVATATHVLPVLYGFESAQILGLCVTKMSQSQKSR